MIQQGALWGSILRTTGHALSTGALVPIRTEQEYIEDNGVRFAVRVLAALQRKDEAGQKRESTSPSVRRPDPFLPPERDLTIGDISRTHVAVLNKYNVVDHHLLLVTRAFEDQDELLTPADCEALWSCLREYQSLAFYNGGREAGASQQHKHLQLVPLPLTPDGSNTPIDPLLEGATAGGIGYVPGFSFSHAFVRLDRGLIQESREASRMIFDLYGGLLRACGLKAPDPSRPTRQTMPYCFLATRNWMLLVPRSREHFEDISLNALAFAGSLYVRDHAQLARLRAAGPMQALRTVTLQRI